MESIKYIYRIGQGPSSSHTMAPRRAAQEFLKLTPDAAAYKVTLYGSLAATGKGHLTDVAITEVLSKVAPMTIEWRPNEVLPQHPNGMKFEALDEQNAVLRSWTTFSVGGGALSDDVVADADVYNKNTLSEIQEWCQSRGYSFWEYVEQCEGPEIWTYLAEVWRVMQEAIKR
ncbi:MAG: serine dehydratase, partial [Bacteroidaceae bacterium]|nr:serine dehydratase [Bacteroidaceae bacterium]